MTSTDSVGKARRPKGARKRLERDGNAALAPNDRGFTLMGLMITTAIIAVLVSIAVPPIGNTIRSVRLQSSTSDLAGDLAMARIEALKRNRVVVVTFTSATEYEIEFVGTRRLENGAAFLEGPDTIRFAPFGPMLTGPAQFVVGLGNDTRTLSLSASGLLLSD